MLTPTKQAAAVASDSGIAAVGPAAKLESGTAAAKKEPLGPTKTVRLPAGKVVNVKAAAAASVAQQLVNLNTHGRGQAGRDSPLKKARPASRGSAANDDQSAAALPTSSAVPPSPTSRKRPLAATNTADAHESAAAPQPADKRARNVAAPARPRPPAAAAAAVSGEKADHAAPPTTPLKVSVSRGGNCASPLGRRALQPRDAPPSPQRSGSAGSSRGRAASPMFENMAKLANLPASRYACAVHQHVVSVCADAY